MSFNCYYIRTADFNAASGGGPGVVITRDNYEAFFVMYVDEELNAAEREAVAQFVQQNPDLEEELVMLQQSVLRPDDSIVFEHKENLFRHSAGEMITEENCEEYFVLYGDDELTNEEKEKVELFVYKHPQYQADFELIQQVKLVPDNSVSFPDKTYLYRSEEDDARVIAFPWWRFAAAAITLLIIGGGAFYLSTHFAAHSDNVAVAKPTKPATKATLPLPGELAPATDEASTAVTNKTEPVKADQSVAKTTIKKNISKQRNIQSPSYVQQVTTQQPEDTPAGENEKPLSARLVDVAVSKLYKQPEVKGTVITNTVSNTIAANTAAVQPDEEPDQSHNAVLTASVNKTPLRGFFRKVSRVVDKVTNPDDNGKTGIRIANLEFAIK